MVDPDIQLLIEAAIAISCEELDVHYKTSILHADTAGPSVRLEGITLRCRFQGYPLEVSWTTGLLQLDFQVSMQAAAPTRPSQRVFNHFTAQFYDAIMARRLYRDEQQPPAAVDC